MFVFESSEGVQTVADGNRSFDQEDLMTAHIRSPLHLADISSLCLDGRERRQAYLVFVGFDRIAETMTIATNRLDKLYDL